jgi:hypothetical protein
MEDNTQERILSWMSEADLLDPRPVAFDERLFGRIVYYRASAPARRDGAFNHHRLAPGL